jgi:hypothetical protein
MHSWVERLKRLFNGNKQPETQSLESTPKHIESEVKVPKPVIRRERPTLRLKLNSSIQPRQVEPKVRVLQYKQEHPAVPYWKLRNWRKVSDNLYLGYYKTRLGRCHGVIKWNSQYDCSFYIHEVPQVILKGPHGSCFVQVKEGKYRIHFSQLPLDLNSGIFYVEILLQKAFENEQKETEDLYL